MPSALPTGVAHLLLSGSSVHAGTGAPAGHARTVGAALSPGAHAGAAVGLVRSFQRAEGGKFRRAHATGHALVRAKANADADHYLTGTTGGFPVTGSFRVDNSSVYTEAADRLTADGHRRAIGILVYVRDALAPEDADSVPINRHFLVSAGFGGEAGDPLYDLGAGPNYVGRKVRLRGNVVLQFRPPVRGDVVIMVPTKSALRYEENDADATAAWKPYLTAPQRSLAAQRITALFDPDGILDFYAMLHGVMASRFAAEAAELPAQHDPDTAPLDALPAIAADYALTIPADTPEAVQRALLRSAVPVAKIAGTDRSVILRLLAYGYDAVVHEVWINPGAPLMKILADADGHDGNQPIVYRPARSFDGSLTAMVLVAGMEDGGDNRPAVGYVMVRDNALPADGDTLTLSDGSTSVTFEFDDRRVYEVSIPSTFTSSMGGTLDEAPIVPGSFTGSFVVAEEYLTLTDDGAGHLTGESSDGMPIAVTSGTINYTTGVWVAHMDGPVPSGTLTIQYVADHAVVAPGNTAVAVGADGAEALANLRAAVNASALALTASDATAANFQGGAFPDQQPGVVYPLDNTTDELGCGTAFITVPHGYYNRPPQPPFYPSSRIAVYIADVDGSPVVLTAEQQQRVASVLSPILPAHADIRVFGSAAHAVPGGEGFGLVEEVTTDATPPTFAPAGTILFRGTASCTVGP